MSDEQPAYQNERWSSARVAIEPGFCARMQVDATVVDEKLETLEDSPLLDVLRRSLQHRIAFHHGAMTPDERTFVERGFLERGNAPSVCVLFATRTLGMGINLPADVVVLLDIHTPDINGERLLTVAEYRNYAGRAGRLLPDRHPESYGLVILREKADYRCAASELIRNPIEPISSSLVKVTYGAAAHVLSARAFHEAFKRNVAIGEPLD